MEHFNARAKAASDYVVRDSFEGRATGCRCHAENLAHCIAMFGDLDLNQVGFQQLRRFAARQTGEHRVHWLRGLDLAQECIKYPDVFASQSTL